MIPERYAPQVYALFRIVVGFLFMFHGLQKIFGMFGGMQGATAPMMSMPWFAGVIETVGGVLVMVGLLTRVAAFICSGEMAAAYFMVHQPRGTWPIQNGGSWRRFTASRSCTSRRAALESGASTVRSGLGRGSDGYLTLRRATTAGGRSHRSAAYR